MTSWMGAETLAAALNGVCQALVLTAAVWGALRLVRLSASARYAVWMAALAAVAALPVVNLAWPRAAAAVALGGPVASSRLPGLLLPEPGAWVAWAAGAWIAIAAVMLARLAAGYAGLARLKRSAVDAPEAVQERIRQVAGPGRTATVKIGQVDVPVAAGLWKPAILLPAGLAEELSEAELDQVLVHELAHLRRRDDWTNLLARLVEAVFFFQPAVWWIGRRLSVEREIACDDCVVGGAGAVAPYAACLLKLAGGAAARRGPQLAHAAVSGKREFTVRIEALLAATRAVRSPKAAVLALVALVGGLAAAAPEFGLFSVAQPAQPAVRAALVAAAPLARPASPVRQATRLVRTSHAAAIKHVAAVSRAGRRPAPLTIDTYYVFFLNDSGPRWIQILWVCPLPERPPLNGV
jgi:beta-lactamase regulating signal transducer with metallopeptidase domain